MKNNLYVILSCFCCYLFMNCQSEPVPNEEKPKTDIEETPEPEVPKDSATLKILALGDSYTIGQSVCESCRFPEQLKDSIIQKTGKSDIKLEIIARTGWTTSNLKSAISESKITKDQDLVTLLIGVNNQYQNLSFELFKNEFPQLINSAVDFANGEIKKVIVVSIPDYAYTFFGNGAKSVSEDIKRYNNFIESFCFNYGITYIYITDISEKGLEQPELVAPDGLHPSKLAYSKFVERIMPSALEKLKE